MSAAQTVLTGTSTSTGPVNMDNVQGDIILGLPKRFQSFSFFRINDAPDFQQALAEVADLVTSTAQVRADRERIANAPKDPGHREWLPITNVNVAFSASGLRKLGVDIDNAPEFQQHEAFRAGQQADAVTNLADPRHRDTGKLSSWKDEYLQRKIDVVISVTAATASAADEEADEIEDIFGKSASLVTARLGNVRPGASAGHEHFDYLDGVAMPRIKSFNDDKMPPGDTAIDAKVVLTGLDAGSDSILKDGTFMVFRELQQLVPEFNNFVKETAIGFNTPGVTADVVGARLVGRWKSGAPLILSPTKDDPKLGADANRRQDFDYSTDLKQEVCPYAAHIRKTAPRAGTTVPASAFEERMIMRHGIPYGPEVQPYERLAQKTQMERGLLFVCYQSSIETGFQFIQKSWANEGNFPPNAITAANVASVGQDILIGQVEAGARSVQGIKPGGAEDSDNVVKTMNTFVVPRGGEYFFVPSLEVLKNKLAIDDATDDGGDTSSSDCGDKPKRKHRRGRKLKHRQHGFSFLGHRDHGDKKC